MKHIPVCAQDQDQLLANGDANESDGKVRGWRSSGGWKRSAGGCVYVYV